MSRVALPTGYLKDEGTVLTDASNLAAWTAGGSAPSGWVTQNSSLGKLGASAIEFTQTSQAAQFRTITKQSISWDLSRVHVVLVSIYVPLSSPTLASVAGLNIWLSNHATLAQDRVFYSIPTTKLTPGWNLVPIHRADFVAQGTGTFSWTSAVQSARFEFTGSASTLQSVVFDGIVALRRCRPKVLLTFDDGYESSYTEAFAYTDPRDVRMTHFLIDAAIGTSTYLTLAQAQAMYDAGDAIGVHDSTTWPDNSDPAGRVSAQKAALRARGWTRGNDSAAYPSGQYGQSNSTASAFLTAMASAGFKLARCASSTQSTAITPANGHFNALTIPATIALDSGTSLATAYTRLDRALLHGGTVFIFGHKVGASADSLTWTISDFQALVDRLVLYRNQGLIDIVTVDQWYDGLTHPRLPTDRIAA